MDGARDEHFLRLSFAVARRSLTPMATIPSAASSSLRTARC
ncbi:hypothetical protein AB7M38_003396 [Bradyrhizobium diazoefficiens]